MEQGRVLLPSLCYYAPAAPNEARLVCHTPMGCKARPAPMGPGSGTGGQACSLQVIQGTSLQLEEEDDEDFADEPEDEARAISNFCQGKHA